ncbi:MAG: Omp28 family outer membrane lipoprotein, partial [Bacteroidales bacterium]|nr:Omp28 family outer membrane lipoprotein [Bacteroidales bacterium]
MKKFVIIFLLLSLSVFFNSCDVIEEPYIEEGSLVWNGRKSLLLDFTGHTCGNCPDGHNKIEAILNNYGEAVIPVAIHCGWYSRIEGSNINQPFYYDFTTDIGFELGGDGITTGGALGVQGQPIGVVNVLKGDALKSPSAWASEVAKYISSFPQYEIEIDAFYNSVDSIIECNVIVESITENRNELHLVVYVLENNIVQWQRDYGSDPENVENYEHNHVLRGGFNGTWGEAIADKVYTEKTYQTKLGKDWVPNNCLILAFVYNSETYEVLQAEEIKLI